MKRTKTLTNAIDDKLIDQIVVEVLAQLRQRIGSAPPSSKTQPSEPVSIPEKPAKDQIELADAVVTAEVLQQHAKAGGSIRLSPRAIVTPSARDYIKSQGLSIRREEQNGQARFTSPQGRGAIIAAHLPGVVQSFLADVKKHSESLWTVEIESGTSQVVERIHSILCRGEFQQALVFVKNPSHVACLVNRNPNCRAALVQNGSDVRRVRAEFGANAICLDLQQPTFIGLKEVLRSCGQTAGLIQQPGNEV